MNDKMFEELKKPFHPSHVSWKPGNIKGERALAMPYADLRTYMNRLDEVCGADWSVAYEPWGDDRLICKLTIAGVTRSSTGEANEQDEKNNLAGSVMEAMAFKRAAAMFGLGRYLYTLPNGWADFDPKTKKFTERAKAKLTGILVQHYRRATEGNPTELADIFGKGEPEHEAPAQDAAPSYVAAWHKLTGKRYDLVNWIQQLHRKDCGPASKAQYGFVVGVIDELTANRHDYALSVLCQSEISGDNPPSKEAAQALLKYLAKTVKVKDDAGNEVKQPNPQYRQDMADMVTDIAQAQAEQQPA